MVDGHHYGVVVDLDDLATPRLTLVSGTLGSDPSLDSCAMAYLDAWSLLYTPSAMHHSFQSSSLISMSSSPVSLHSQISNFNLNIEPVFATTKKRYKPVSKRTVPVKATLPDKFRIIRQFPTNPLENLPYLNPIPTPFQPTGRYTQERMEFITKVHDSNFLWPHELMLIHNLMMLHNRAFAWEESERGHFNHEYFAPVEMAVVDHVPWVERSIPIPPGLFDAVIKILREKIAAGVYEPSNSSYRTRWFTVLKKDGVSLRPVHDLQPLNKVSIQDSSIIPHTELLAESYACRSALATLDLFVGYDNRAIAVDSRDYTTFQTPLGALRLTTIPMGWTNSVQVFHGDVTFILQPEIPTYCIPYIDDVNVKGPPTRYELPDGGYEVIPENPGVRCFVWELLMTVNRVLTRMTYAGGTFSGKKTLIVAEKAMVVGHFCTYEGRVPDESRVSKIRDWGLLKDLHDVRAFLGTAGLCRAFIWQFGILAEPLVRLTRKGVPFQMGSDETASQDALKKAIIACPAIRPLDYDSTAPIILVVDSCAIAVGFVLMQSKESDPSIRFINRFGSINMNEREARYSQAKLELYGLFRALRSVRLWIIGAKSLVVEMDAKYVKGMLNNPDIQPNAAVNRWIAAILLFSFTLVHVPADRIAADGLSRRRPQPRDPEEPEEDLEDWIDAANGFMHVINPSVHSPSCLNLLPSSRAFSGEFIFSGEGAPPQQDASELRYELVPRSNKAKSSDAKLDDVRDYLISFQRPTHMSDAQYNSFIRYSLQFFVDSYQRLWRKDSQGQHRIVIPQVRRLPIIREAHDRIGHKGIWATSQTIRERFWWPQMLGDIRWWILTCLLCQLRQLNKLRIPPVVAEPLSLFTKCYMDTLEMPRSAGFRYLVHGRCSSSAYPEFRKLRRQTGDAIATWIFEDILCRWGALRVIVTDNGPPFLLALDSLATRYGIRHITICRYNSQAAGVIECKHFDVRESLVKAADGVESRWALTAHSVFWAERVTARRSLGVSPYFLAHGVHPILPLDIYEASYLLPPPSSTLSTLNLIVRRSRELQKRMEDLEAMRQKIYKSRQDRVKKLEESHARTIKDYDFKRGSLVLVRNTRFDKTLGHKARMRYLGPLIILSRNRGGAYIVCELDGTVWKRPVGAFRVIPYRARHSLPIPDLDDFLDVSRKEFDELKSS